MNIRDCIEVVADPEIKAVTATVKLSYQIPVNKWPADDNGIQALKELALLSLLRKLDEPISYELEKFYAAQHEEGTG